MIPESVAHQGLFGKAGDGIGGGEDGEGESKDFLDSRLFEGTCGAEHA